MVTVRGRASNPADLVPGGGPGRAHLATPGLQLESAGTARAPPPARVPASCAAPIFWRIVSSPTVSNSAEPPALTRDDVDHLAHLARLELTEVELNTYVGQLSVILDSVSKVTGVTSGAEIEPTTHAVPLTNVYRPDVAVPSLSPAEALAGAPSAQDGRFRVPQILGEEQ
jgi:aspartyl-tRNA(Asn)/glutamyl-tRNA(Gln) amidotransferase subunit C